jgi:hypothetical protein
LSEITETDEIRLVFDGVRNSRFGCPPASAQTKSETTSDPRLGLANIAPIGYTNSRWQEAGDPEGESDPVGLRDVNRVLQLGTGAVPLLIGCLTDTKSTRTPIGDYWPQTRLGDIAFSILCDLFSDPARHLTLKGAITWKDVEAEFPNRESWIAWNSYLAKHGRAYIQQNWQRAWTQNKYRIHWDNSERCFR